MTLPKPTPPIRAKMGPIRPKCECGHAKRLHTCATGCTDDWCEKCGAECQTYRPRLSVRKPVPVARKERPKRKPIQRKPKCRTCAHPAKAHPAPEPGLITACSYCLSCDGYVPARRTSRQSRRTPLAAIREVADVLWSKLVKTKGSCEIQQYHQHVCGGGHQAMHGAPRTFKATRWLLVNGFEGCRDVHKFFTERPEAWSALLLEAWGLETFREIWARARSSEKPDMEATVAALRSEARERGVE